MRMSTEAEPPNTSTQLRAEVLRRQLRIAIARARQASGMTQRATAEALDWSVSKVVRIEQGAVPVAPSDVRVLLGLFEEKDPNRVDGLFQLAKQAREAKSLSDYNDVTSASFRELVAQEGSASTIWKYEPAVVPGYFQTADYAVNLLMSLGYTADGAARRSQLRVERQRILDNRTPEINVVIGEISLRRLVGTKQTMRDQIRQLIEVNKLPQVSIHILPFVAGAHPGMGRPFTILQFSDDDLIDSLYLDDAEKGSTSLDTPGQVEHYLNLYGQLLNLASSDAVFEELAGRILEETAD